MAATIVPAAFLGVVELGLRVAGFGYPTSFLVRAGGGDGYKTNHRFGWRFFPPGMARAPDPCEIPAGKPEGVYRVFVLGGSAAMGMPDPAYGLPRMLEAMLEDRFPEARFEVVNAAMTAVNSHAVLPIARDCAGFEPDLFVVFMGNNEVVGPYGSGTVFGPHSPRLGLIRASIGVKKLRTAQAIERLLGAGRTQATWRGMEMFLGNQVADDDPRMSSVYDHFAANLADIYEAGRRAGADVIVCTVAVNLRDCPPFASRHRPSLSQAERERWQDHYDGGVALDEAGQPIAALAEYERAAAIDDRHAELHFRIARRLLAAGRIDEARDHFVLARDLDTLRFRADSRINDVIRSVAADRADCGTALVDAERLFAQDESSLGSLPGRELFYEHVHLTPEGNYLLARAIVDHLLGNLPEKLRAAARRPESATLEQCCRRMALTQWDRRRLELEMLDMMQKPPFTAQMGRGEIAARRRRLDEQVHSQMAATWLKQARPVYDEALRRNPDNPRTRAGYARVLQNLGCLDEAVAQLRTLHARFPENLGWRMQFGAALTAAGKTEEAVALYREALESPNAPAASMHFNIAVAHLEAGRLAEAEAGFRRTLELDPRDVQAKSNLGTALTGQKRFDEAVTSYRQLIEDHPNSIRARLNLAAALDQQGRTAEAIAACREAVAADPACLESYWTLASVFARAGKPDDAVRTHVEAVRAVPDSAQARYRLGNAEEQAGQISTAMEQYRAALQIEPTHARAAHNLATILERLGNTEDAIVLYRRVLAYHPGFPATANNLARILSCHPDPARRDGAEAVRLMEAVCREAGAEDPGLLDTMAAAYAEAGRFAEAVATAQEAMRLASRRRDSAHAAALQRKLRLYQDKKPFREGARPAGD